MDIKMDDGKPYGGKMYGPGLLRSAYGNNTCINDHGVLDQRQWEYALDAQYSGTLSLCTVVVKAEF